MPFLPVVLFTDWLIGALLAAVAVLVWYVRGHEHLAAPWQRVARSKSGMVGLTVLAVYVVVGVLDSLHFRPRLEAGEPGRPVYAVEVLSLFDVI
ncbi:MAG: ABC transporter permease, partial [Betaproteobacteria bacterium]|nr:ABC transporter permease [Betaproteobacteria bacterium]